MDASSPLRIVIFPWPAFGHLLPHLELAERLAVRGHSVFYVSTPRNLARLPPLHPSTAPRIDLVALPGSEDGAESSYDLPDEKQELHMKIFDGLAGPFAEFLAAACADEVTRPHWIVGCTFHHLAAAAANQHKVPFAVLLPTAAMLASVPRPPPSEHLEAAAVAVFEKASAAAQAVPGYERRGMATLRSASIVQRSLLTQERSTLGVMRSCYEWEPESFSLVSTLLGKLVLPLGLLPPSADGGRADKEHATVRWLDAQPPGSVLYVAMGSEVRLREEQVRELAVGLEHAGVRFLWALRKPSGAVDADVLPPGFQERTRGHGLVSMGWVPQMSILAHVGVGGFLTHCGRNSLIEGLLFGHPLVMLPMFGDQGPNARQMEAKKVGLQVPRDEEDGSFDRHGIATTVQAVMLDGEARRCFLSGAAKMKEVVADKEIQDRYIDEFIQHLRSYYGAAPKSI